MIRSKAETFIGFAVRKRALVTGANAVNAVRGRVWLMLLCDTASDNTKKEAEKTARRKRCPLMLCRQPLAMLAGKENCKVAAVTDRALAAAICEYADDKFTLISGEQHGGQDSDREH